MYVICMYVCLSVCMYVCMSVCMYVTILTLRYKTKTKTDIKLKFAGVADYVASNILSKFESPILNSSEVMGGKKIVT